MMAFPELEPVQVYRERFYFRSILAKHDKTHRAYAAVQRWEENLPTIFEPVMQPVFVASPPSPLPPEPVIESVEPPTVSVSDEARALANQGRLPEALSCCDRLVTTEKM